MTTFSDTGCGMLLPGVMLRCAKLIFGWWKVRRVRREGGKGRREMAKERKEGRRVRRRDEVRREGREGMGGQTKER